MANEEQKVDELRKEAATLQNAVSFLTQDRDRLESEKADLETKRDAAKKQAHVAEEVRVQALIKAKDAKNDLEQKHTEMTDLNAKITGMSLKNVALMEEIRTREVRLKDLEDALKAAEREAERAISEADKAKQQMGVDIAKSAQLMKHIEEKQRHFNEIVEKVTERSIQNDAFANEIASKQTELARLHERIKELQSKMDNAQKRTEQALREAGESEEAAEHAKRSIQQYTAQANEQKRQLEAFQQDINDSEMKLNRLNAEIEARKRAREELADEFAAKADKKDEYIDLFESIPPCLHKDRFPSGEMPDCDENEALWQVKNYLSDNGLRFPERTINAFHTSLKVADIIPLTVLAGVSGTGKTLLPLKYAEAMGMYSLVMSVQPRWDSPQDMLGFYNYMESKYKSTELVRALIRMDRRNFQSDDSSVLQGQKREDRMLLVLLDEMNLARTEYYFSEFLSKLEIRYAVEDRSKAEIELETGPGKHGHRAYRLWVGHNVIFVGTMNEDESTQALSDKVLDRANVLRFGKPCEDPEQPAADEESRQKKESYLSYKNWKKWIENPTNVQPWDTVVAEWLSTINDALDKIGRPFGYRVKDAIRAYIANYPEDNYKNAFADQVELKILPKLRGIDMMDQRSSAALGEIEKVLDELNDDPLSKAFRQSKEEDSTGTFVWHGVTRPL